MDREYDSIEDFFFKALNQPLPVHKRVKYFMRRTISNIKLVPKRIKWFYQRGKRGYSEADTWSFDTYLAQVIAGGVGRLSERNFGYPHGMAPEEWSSILEKIAKGFGETDKWGDYNQPAFDEAMELFSKYFHDLWD